MWSIVWCNWPRLVPTLRSFNISWRPARRRLSWKCLELLRGFTMIRWHCKPFCCLVINFVYRSFIWSCLGKDFFCKDYYISFLHFPKQVSLCNLRLCPKIVFLKLWFSVVDRSTLNAEIQCVMRAAARDYIREWCSLRERDARSRQTVLRNLQKQQQSILDFRQSMVSTTNAFSFLGYYYYVFSVHLNIVPV